MHNKRAARRSFSQTLVELTSILGRDVQVHEAHTMGLLDDVPGEGARAIVLGSDGDDFIASETFRQVEDLDRRVDE